MKLKQLLMLGPLVVIAAMLATACHHNDGTSADDNDTDYYTCTMHPSVRSHDPHGKCPICGMNLVHVVKLKPGATNGTAGTETNRQTTEAPQEFMVPVERQQQIGVTYATIERRPLRSTIRTVGTVSLDKQRQWEFVSRVDGYLQKLEVSSPGEPVGSNQPLLSVYSPDLLTAQREYLELLQMRDAAEKSNSPAVLQTANNLLESARHRLALWNLMPEQIASLQETRQATDTLSFYSPFRGIVQNIPVEQGQKISAGDPLIGVADLSVVWVWAQFYQDELPMLKPGMPVEVTTDACDGGRFRGKIAVIDPFLDGQTRTARVRVDIENPDFKLRPGMFANVALEVDDGEGPTVPASAVLPTGERNIVFVDRGGGRLEPRFVHLGREYGDFYEIKSGLKEGERVVNSANFLIDAEAQVQGALKTW